MISFCGLPILIRSLFALWVLLLCCLGIAGSILGAVVKRYRQTVISLLCLASAYFLWQTIMDLNRHGVSGQTGTALDTVPWILWLIVMVILSAAAGFSLFYTFWYSRTVINPLIINQCVDQMDCGICYWRDNGRIIFANRSMNRLSYFLTGEPLLNGKIFRDALPDDILFAFGRAWKFESREMIFGKELLYEMTAVDVTEIYEETEALRKANEKFSDLRNELMEYNLKIDDTVRKREILQAKENIHDEMNRLILLTAAADNEDTDSMNHIFELWEKNALLLCREADENKSSHAAEVLEQLAETMNLQIIWNNKAADLLTDSQKELFYTAAREAAVNAVKHAGAETMSITIEKMGKSTCCNFENDGRIPSGEVHFTGGLEHLSFLAEQQNAEISARTGDTFCLTLKFNGKN